MRRSPVSKIVPMNLVFMLEEESAKSFLEVLLPKILPSCVRCTLIPHQGKSDLQKSIPKKLRAWSDPNSFFVILHDQDGNNCVDLKNQLQKICHLTSRYSPLICIACHELEAWYFGDLDALQKAFPGFCAKKYRNKARFRIPDDIVQPAKVLEKEKKIRGFGKVYAAQKVSKYMDIKRNRSNSFQYMVKSIENLVNSHLHIC